MLLLQRLINPLPQKVFRYLCLLTALANSLGNIFLLLFYRPLFNLLSVPLPQDLYSFSAVSGFSFTIGILAFLIYLNPEKNQNLLIVGSIGKGIYGFFTFYFYTFKGLHWFYMIFGIWDAVFMVIFSLFLTQLLSQDLNRINKSDILDGLKREPTKKALLLFFSLTSTCQSGMGRIKAGLERYGYTVDTKVVETEEKIFRFPMSFMDFVKINIRAFFRKPARIKPLNIPRNHSYDLIVVGTQTWLAGMSAPVESIFLSPENRAIFVGRDVAVLNVCRGLWRRSQAMLVRWLQNCGANIVGVRAFGHIGWEPSRLFSLWFYLIYKEPGRPRFLDGFVQKCYGLSDESLKNLESYGQGLAQRKRIKEVEKQ